YERGNITEERSSESGKAIEVELEAKAKAGLKLPEWLKPLSFDIEAGGKLKEDTKESTGVKTVAQLNPIWNAERKLEELVRHYLFKFPDRIAVNGRSLIGAGEEPQDWYSAPPDAISRFPRPLIFLDLPEKVKLIPTAAEFVSGKISLLYDDLA